MSYSDHLLSSFSINRANFSCTSWEVSSVLAERANLESPSLARIPKFPEPRSAVELAVSDPKESRLNGRKTRSVSVRKCRNAAIDDRNSGHSKLENFQSPGARARPWTETAAGEVPGDLLKIRVRRHLLNIANQSRRHRPA